MSSSTDMFILKNGVRRRLEMPFRICLSREAAKRLREELKKATHDEWNYGWIDINPTANEPATSALSKEWTD